MTRTITRSYDSYTIAAEVVEKLETAGIPASDISLVGRNERGEESNAAEGAGIGAGVGGAAGLLAGLGMLARRRVPLPAPQPAAWSAPS